MAARKKIEYSPEFLELKEIYPKRPNNPWPLAFKQYNSRIKEGYTHEEIKVGLTRYVTYCDKTGKTGSEFVLQASTFFGINLRWEDEFEIPKPRIQDQFKGMNRDQQIAKKAEIIHLTPNKGELMHEWTSRVNSEWLKRYPSN